VHSRDTILRKSNQITRWYLELLWQKIKQRAIQITVPGIHLLEELQPLLSLSIFSAIRFLLRCCRHRGASKSWWGLSSLDSVNMCQAYYVSSLPAHVQAHHTPLTIRRPTTCRTHFNSTTDGLDNELPVGIHFNC
jgi:hypothetical protein